MREEIDLLKLHSDFFACLLQVARFDRNRRLAVDAAAKDDTSVDPYLPQIRGAQQIDRPE